MPLRSTIKQGCIYSWMLINACVYVSHSGLQCHEHESHTWTRPQPFIGGDILQRATRGKTKNLFSLNVEGLYYHLAATGVQTIPRTMTNERQRIVFIDDPWILMKKHAQRDILRNAKRAVAIVSPPLCLVPDYMCLFTSGNYWRRFLGSLAAWAFVCVCGFVCVCVWVWGGEWGDSWSMIRWILIHSFIHEIQWVSCLLRDSTPNALAGFIITLCIICKEEINCFHLTQIRKGRTKRNQYYGAAQTWSRGGRQVVLHQ